jgi:hypothetical protein
MADRTHIHTFDRPRRLRADRVAFADCFDCNSTLSFPLVRVTRGELGTTLHHEKCWERKKRPANERTSHGK